MIVRRIVLVFSIVLCGSLALAAAALAAGGGFGTGKTTFSSTAANATFGTPKGGTAPLVSVSVNQGYNAFKPMHPNGPRIIAFDTMVQYMELDPTTGDGGFGCFVVPDANFTVSKDLQSATLNTTLTADEACPGFGAPATSMDPTAFAGGSGGGGGGLNLPISINLTWTGNGVVSTNQDRSSFQCLKYSEASTSTFSDSIAGAAGAVSSLPGAASTDLADVSSSKGTLDISGTPQPACFGY